MCIKKTRGAGQGARIREQLFYNSDAVQFQLWNSDFFRKYGTSLPS